MGLSKSQMTDPYFLSGEELAVVKNIIYYLPEKFVYVSYMQIGASYSCWLSLQEKKVLIEYFEKQNFKLMINPQLLPELKRTVNMSALI